MRRAFTAICLALAMCLALTGCDSQDYEKAVKLQEAGDCEAALELLRSIESYEDSADRIAQCERLVAAAGGFDSAKNAATKKNSDLDAAILRFEGLATGEEQALDEDLLPSLEMAISSAIAAKKPISEMPSDVADIEAATSKLNAIDYTEVLLSLEKSGSALEASIRQYALVNAPSEVSVIARLKKVPTVTKMAAVTEGNDPNGQLNKAGGYTAQMYFYSNMIDQKRIAGKGVIGKGTDGGGSIEVYTTPEDAEKRNAYLAGFDGSIFASGSHKVIGTVIVRTSSKLKASQQKKLQADLIAALTSI